MSWATSSSHLKARSGPEGQTHLIGRVPGRKAASGARAPCNSCPVRGSFFRNRSRTPSRDAVRTSAHSAFEPLVSAKGKCVLTACPIEGGSNALRPGKARFSGAFWKGERGRAGSNTNPCGLTPSRRARPRRPRRTKPGKALCLVGILIVGIATAHIFTLRVDLLTFRHTRGGAGVAAAGSFLPRRRDRCREAASDSDAERRAV